MQVIRLILIALVGAAACLVPAAADAADGNGAPSATGKGPGYEIVLSGKLFCPVKRPVLNYFPGQVTSLRVRAGQRVKRGQVLATYQLDPEALLRITARLHQSPVDELKLRVAEMERALDQLRTKRDGIAALHGQSLAADKSLPEMERSVTLLEQRLEVTKRRLRHTLKEKAEELAILGKKMGREVHRERVPREARVVAPMDGVVVWVNPLVRQGAELTPTAMFQVGVMSPMLVRCQVHEIEAMRLALGNEAEVTMEALPGFRFAAKVSRIDWAPTSTDIKNPTYYTVELTAPNPDLILKEGLKCRLIMKKAK